MKFEYLFEYSGLKNTYNVALLPSFIKGLLEIQRIESLRENNRTTKDTRLIPLGSHGLWEAKRIVLKGFSHYDWGKTNIKHITVESIDTRYDHIITIEKELPDLQVDDNPDKAESYIHVYLDENKQEIKRKKIIAPTGVRVLVNSNDEKFTIQFIKANLIKYEIYLLE